MPRFSLRRFLFAAPLIAIAFVVIAKGLEPSFRNHTNDEENVGLIATLAGFAMLGTATGLLCGCDLVKTTILAAAFPPMAWFLTGFICCGIQLAYVLMRDAGFF